MAFKRQHDMMATFSMASMTDVIFLLLIFFMVTSTFVFPTALQVDLPDGTSQTAIKPGARVYIDRECKLFASFGDQEPQPMDESALLTFLTLTKEQAPDQYIAIYADTTVPYGEIVKILNLGAENDFRMVLATKAAPPSLAAASEQSLSDYQQPTPVADEQ